MHLECRQFPRVDRNPLPQEPSSNFGKSPNKIVPDHSLTLCSALRLIRSGDRVRRPQSAPSGGAALSRVQVSHSQGSRRAAAIRLARSRSSTGVPRETNTAGQWGITCSTHPRPRVRSPFDSTHVCGSSISCTGRRVFHVKHEGGHQRPLPRFRQATLGLRTPMAPMSNRNSAVSTRVYFTRVAKARLPPVGTGQSS